MAFRIRSGEFVAKKRLNVRTSGAERTGRVLGGLWGLRKEWGGGWSEDVGLNRSIGSFGGVKRERAGGGVKFKFFDNEYGWF